MIPNLSSLRLAPVGLYAEDDDDYSLPPPKTDAMRARREKEEAELVAHLAKIDAEEKLWPELTYRLIASDPDLEPQSEYFAYLKDNGEDVHVEEALHALRRVLNGVYGGDAASAAYMESAQYYADADEFAVHYGRIYTMSWSFFMAQAVRSFLIDKNRDNSKVKQAFQQAVPTIID